MGENGSDQVGWATQGRRGAEEASCQVPTRADIVAAAFAAADEGASFDPLRIQKLLFLIDREGSDPIGGPFFDFRPYRYGPFDRAIYGVVDQMLAAGSLWADTSGPYPRYRLSARGRREGEEILASLPKSIADYFGRVARWVRLMPYRQMLAAIYREYPEMASGSVVRELATKHPAPRRNPFVRGMRRAFDITGGMYGPRGSDAGVESDSEAIRDIWRTVGRDIENAMVRFGEGARLW